MTLPKRNRNDSAEVGPWNGRWRTTYFPIGLLIIVNPATFLGPAPGHDRVVPLVRVRPKCGMTPNAGLYPDD